MGTRCCELSAPSYNLFGENELNELDVVWYKPKSINCDRHGDGELGVYHGLFHLLRIHPHS